MAETLCVGMDDSNHAGTTKGEIILATFSFSLEDSVVRTFKNNRDSEYALGWISEQDKRRDYRFTLLFDEEARRRSTNLVYTAPLLIRNFIKDHPETEVDSLKLYLDGPLSLQSKRYLKHEFRDFSDFVVGNFIKKRVNRVGRTMKRPICPPLVYVADIYANRMFYESLNNCLQHPKFIPFRPTA